MSFFGTYLLPWKPCDITPSWLLPKAFPASWRSSPGPTTGRLDVKSWLSATEASPCTAFSFTRNPWPHVRGSGSSQTSSTWLEFGSRQPRVQSRKFISYNLLTPEAHAANARGITFDSAWGLY